MAYELCLLLIRDIPNVVSSAQLECVSTSARKTDDPKPIDAIRIRALRYPTSPTTPHEKVWDGLRGTHHTNQVRLDGLRPK